MLRPLLITVFIAFVNSLPAQQTIFSNYSMQDGLASTRVNRIFQDSKGFIWMATWQGLSKYDGAKFTNFNTTNGLSFDFVNDIYESKGKLYLALNNGSIDIIENDRIIQQPAREKFIVNRFFNTKSGLVYAVTDQEGLCGFREGEVYRLPKQIHKNLKAFCELSDSSIIIGGADDYNSFLVTDRHLTPLAKPGDTTIQVSDIYRDRRGRVWVCSNKGLLLLSTQQQRGGFIQLSALPASFNIPDLSGVVTTMLEDTEGNYWIGTLKGLVEIHKNGRRSLYTNKEGLSSNTIRCLYMDKEKSIWVGTNDGISKIVSKNDFQIFMAEDLISDIYPSTASGICFITGSGAVKKMNVDNHSIDTVSVSGIIHPARFVDQGNQLFLYSGETLVNIEITKNKTGNIRIWPGRGSITVTADSSGNFFFGTQRGIWIKPGHSGKAHPFGSVPYAITSFTFDHQGNLWVGTWSEGLYRLHISNKGGEVSCVTENISRLVPAGHIRALFTDRNGNIWVGTRYNGITRITEEKGHFSTIHFSQKQGLISNFPCNIVEDNKGNIWIVHYTGGLDKLIPAGDSFRVFNFSRVNNFFKPVFRICPAAENVFWCATSTGLVRFTDDEVDQLPPPKVFITRLQTGRPKDIRAVTDMNQPLLLTHEQNILQFEFSAPSFINEKEISYRHRLAGSPDTSWSSPANQHSVFYASLQPGNYTFEVKAQGWNGDWGEAAVYPFTIRPPWWQTWWCRAGALLIIAAIITLIVRRRISNISREAALQQRVVETEMMALRAQMNPHFIFNCINSIDGLIQSNDKYYATVYLNKFARLIRNILDSSKQNTVTLAKDLETLQLYIDLEQLRHENKFTVSIKADNTLLQDDYKVPALVVQPYVENAILHGLKNRPDNDGKLVITVSRQQGYIEYIIEDNGVGRDALKNRTRTQEHSYGMQMSGDRVKFFNNEENASVVVTDLKVNGTATGTRVQVLLKLL